MNIDRERIIQKYIEGYNEFDVDKMTRDLDDQIVFRNIQNEEVNMMLNGISEFKQQAEASKSYFEKRQQKITSIHHIGNITEVEVEYSAVLGMDFPNGPYSLFKTLLSMFILSTLIGCRENISKEKIIGTDTTYGIQTSITNKKETEYLKDNIVVQYKDTVLGNFLAKLGLSNEFWVSTNHQPFYITGDFNSDNEIDSAIIIRKKENQKDGVLIKYGYRNEFDILGAGEEVLSQGFDDFNWIGEFYKIDKGVKVASNLDENGEIITEEIPDSLKITLPSDGIYIHAKESCGGGIIYWDNAKYNWIQQE